MDAEAMINAQVCSSVSRPIGEHKVAGMAGVFVSDPITAVDHEGAEWSAATLSGILDLIAEREPARDQEDSVVSSAFYDLSNTFKQWRAQIPSAAALQPLYEPTAPLVGGAEVDEPARRLFSHSLDGRGIRSRGAVLTWLADERTPWSGLWTSLACGAARPTCVALAGRRRAGSDQQLLLLDRDERALALAEDFASSTGVARALTTVRADVLKERDVYAAVEPESCSLVEALGFFEYLPVSDRGGPLDAVSFLRLAYSLVEPGGMLVIANMLDSHPQLPFTLHAVRWPFIQPRSLGQILTIVDSAGIDRSCVEVWLPDDGVYAVLSLTK